jgi:enamine deaminase RidA (YjgF/YER057c/UK114 family)
MKKSRKMSAPPFFWVKNIPALTEMNEVWDNWVPEGCAPARACIIADTTDPMQWVEIVIVAAV